MKLMEQIGPGENVLWFGKKARHVTAAEAIINPFLPVALIWLVLEGVFFFEPVPLSELDGNKIIGLIFGMLPLWIYLIVVLCIAFGTWRTEYCLTDKGIYVVYGNSIPKKLVMKRYGEISEVKIKRGFFDKFLGTGDVSVMCYSEVNEPNANIEVNGVPLKSANELTIQNITDYQNVMLLIQQKQQEADAENNYINEPESRDFGSRPLPGNGRTQAQRAAAVQKTVFSQPVAAQPMFSDPERGFNAVRGSFVAEGQPQGVGVPIQPSVYGQPERKPSVPQQPVQASPPEVLLQPTALTEPEAPPVPPPVQPAHTQNASEQPLLFDIPELAQEISLAGQSAPEQSVQDSSL